MGSFSWLYANSGKPLNSGMKAYVYTPSGEVIEEKSYDGFGEFGGQDIYDLLADWNREFLSRHPDFLIYQSHDEKQANGTYRKAAPRRIDSFFWYKHYADLSLSRKEVERRSFEDPDNVNKSGEHIPFQYRYIGIDIGCGYERNAWLPYPIKIATKPNIVDGFIRLPPSKDDPNQGFGRYRDASNDRDNYEPNLLPLPSHVCPVCGGTEFYATAHVAQGWKIDGHGNFLKVIEDCTDHIHDPDDEDIWQCACCGLDEPGAYFNALNTKTASERPDMRFVLLIYDRNIPYVKGLPGLDCNRGKVHRKMQKDTLSELYALWEQTKLLHFANSNYHSCVYALKDTKTGLTLLEGTFTEKYAPREFLRKLKLLASIPVEKLWETETVYYATDRGVRVSGPFGTKADALLASEKLRKDFYEANESEADPSYFSIDESEEYVAHLICEGAINTEQKNANSIPDEMAAKFDTVEGRKAIIDAYKDSKAAFSGKDADGCSVCISVSETGIVLNTYQKNHWVRVNYYDANGEPEGETFAGKW